MHLMRLTEFSLTHNLKSIDDICSGILDNVESTLKLSTSAFPEQVLQEVL